MSKHDANNTENVISGMQAWEWEEARDTGGGIGAQTLKLNSVKLGA